MPIDEEYLNHINNLVDSSESSNRVIQRPEVPMPTESGMYPGVQYNYKKTQKDYQNEIARNEGLPKNIAKFIPYAASQLVTGEVDALGLLYQPFQSAAYTIDALRKGTDVTEALGQSVMDNPFFQATNAWREGYKDYMQMYSDSESWWGTAENAANIIAEITSFGKTGQRIMTGYGDSVLAKSLSKIPGANKIDDAIESTRVGSALAKPFKEGIHGVTDGFKYGDNLAKAGVGFGTAFLEGQMTARPEVEKYIHEKTDETYKKYQEKIDNIDSSTLSAEDKQIKKENLSAEFSKELENINKHAQTGGLITTMVNTALVGMINFRQMDPFIRSTIANHAETQARKFLGKTAKETITADDWRKLASSEYKPFSKSGSYWDNIFDSLWEIPEEEFNEYSAIAGNTYMNYNPNKESYIDKLLMDASNFTFSDEFWATAGYALVASAPMQLAMTTANEMDILGESTATRNKAAADWAKRTIGGVTKTLDYATQLAEKDFNLKKIDEALSKGEFQKYIDLLSENSLETIREAMFDGTLSVKAQFLSEQIANVESEQKSINEEILKETDSAKRDALQLKLDKKKNEKDNLDVLHKFTKEYESTYNSYLVKTKNEGLANLIVKNEFSNARLENDKKANKFQLSFLQTQFMDWANTNNIDADTKDKADNLLATVSSKVQELDNIIDLASKNKMTDLEMEKVKSTFSGKFYKVISKLFSDDKFFHKKYSKADLDINKIKEVHKALKEELETSIDNLGLPSAKKEEAIELINKLVHTSMMSRQIDSMIGINNEITNKILSGDYVFNKELKKELKKGKEKKEIDKLNARRYVELRKQQLFNELVKTEVNQEDVYNTLNEEIDNNTVAEKLEAGVVNSTITTTPSPSTSGVVTPTPVVTPAVTPVTSTTSTTTTTPIVTPPVITPTVTPTTPTSLSITPSKVYLSIPDINGVMTATTAIDSVFTTEYYTLIPGTRIPLNLLSLTNNIDIFLSSWDKYLSPVANVDTTNSDKATTFVVVKPGIIEYQADGTFKVVEKMELSTDAAIKPSTPITPTSGISMAFRGEFNEFETTPTTPIPVGKEFLSGAIYKHLELKPPFDPSWKPFSPNEFILYNYDFWVNLSTYMKSKGLIFVSKDSKEHVFNWTKDELMNMSTEQDYQEVLQVIMILLEDYGAHKGVVFASKEIKLNENQSNKFVQMQIEQESLIEFQLNMDSDRLTSSTLEVDDMNNQVIFENGEPKVKKENGNIPESLKFAYTDLTGKEVILKVEESQVEGEASYDKDNVKQIKVLVEYLQNIFEDVNFELRPSSFFPKGERGLFDPNTNTITINIAKKTTDYGTVIHELSHPFIMAIEQQNPKLFAKLLLQAKEIEYTTTRKGVTIDGKEYIETKTVTVQEAVDSAYGVNENRSHEYIAHALEVIGKDLIKFNKENTKITTNFVKMFLKAITALFKKAFDFISANKGGYIKASDIKINTSLRTIAELMLNGKTKIKLSTMTGSKVSSKDIKEASILKLLEGQINIIQNKKECR